MNGAAKLLELSNFYTKLPVALKTEKYVKRIEIIRQAYILLYNWQFNPLVAIQAKINHKVDSV